ncbi:Fur family transcriptional regulator [Lachnospiraceae bacterium C1.1]|nr:transcriptional repressor [Lachnospiraceae bacterium C1.1]
MKSSEVLDRLRKSGCRVTRQRRLIVDIILKNDYTTCKDLYCQVASEDDTIGVATVYRMVRQLEDIGVLRRIERIEIADTDA